MENVPEKVETQLPATLDYSSYAGQGTEQAEAGDFALPFLLVLQPLSPQVNEEKAQFIKDSKPGMFFESASGSIYSGKEGIDVILCHFRKDMVEWKKRETGGGFVKAHGWNEQLMGQCTKDERGRMLLPNGNLLVDTKYHYILVLTPMGAIPAVLSMTSTQLKKSRKWLSMISMRKLTDKNGKSFQPPSFAYRYKLTTAQEQNEKGTWYSINVEMGALIEDVNLAREAIKFNKMVREGNVKMSDPDAGMKADIGDDIPF